jgi:hypothetical protein
LKRSCAVLVFLLVVFHVAQAEDSARQLARILADKGVLTSQELAGLERANPVDAVSLLTDLLHIKGVLTNSEVARVNGSDSPLAASVRLVPAVAADQGPAPKQPEAAPPVTTLSRSPLQVYGTVLWNAFENTAGVNIEDIPLLASKRGADPFANFAMTVRQSRLGVRYQGEGVFGAKLAGVAEVDFFGGKAALANGVSMDILRLRLAYGRLDWQNVSIEAGQDWAVFSPLNPTSLATFAIPAMSASGNPWIRSPQFRLDWRGNVSPGTRFLFQAAALDPNIGDNSTTFATSRTPGIGERGRGPAVESRVALLSKIEDRDASIGISSHYNRGLNVGVIGTQTVQRPVDSWGVNLDYTLPLFAKFALTGEAFAGRALGLFSVSSGQTVLPPGTPGEHGVAARGGWVQAQINFSPKWQLNSAYGLESVDVSNLRTGDRAKNQTYMTNLMYKPWPRMTWAWEWRRFLTDYRNQPAAYAIGDHANMAIAYIF